MTEETLTVEIDNQGFRYNPATGEILAVLDLPQNVAIEEIARDWLGPRLSSAQARLAGLEAEKAAWLQRVADQYDARLARQKRWISYLEGLYRPALRDYAARLLEGRKERSIKVGLLTLAFRRTQPKVVVQDEQKAVDWLEDRGMYDTIKTVRSVLKSLIPANVRETITAEETGMAYVPAEDTFEVH